MRASDVRALGVVVAVVWLVAGAACSKKLNPGFCNTIDDCAGGYRCDLSAGTPGKCACNAAACADGGMDVGMEAGMEAGKESGMEAGPETLPCTAASCTGPTPICDDVTKKCRGCAQTTECAALDGGQPVCVGGSCVECGASADCTAMASNPICDATMKTCRACGAAAECADKDATLPACSTGGACVACGVRSDCKLATKPVCSATSNTCGPCVVDADCPGDPGVCMTDGHCALATEVIVVQNIAACDDNAAAAGAGTTAKPLCSMQPVLAMLTAGRRVVVVRGTVSGANWSYAGEGGGSLLVVGTQIATIASGASPILALQSGALSVRNVKFSPSASIGIKATGGTLTLDKVTVDSCMGGGILLDGAAFSIRNTTVTNNGPGQQGTTVWGGILIASLPTSGTRELRWMTVKDNKQTGIICAGAIQGEGVLVTNNAGGVEIVPTCGVTSCASASPTCGAQP